MGLDTGARTGCLFLPTSQFRDCTEWGFWAPGPPGRPWFCVSWGPVDGPVGLFLPRRWLLSGYRVPAHPGALTLGPRQGGPPGRQQRCFDLRAQQLVGGGASPPASCLLSLTAAHPEGQQATWCLLCVPFQCWGRGEGNKTTFGGTSKVQFSNQKEFPSFPLMFCLCVVLGFK